MFESTYRQLLKAGMIKPGEGHTIEPDPQPAPGGFKGLDPETVAAAMGSTMTEMQGAVPIAQREDCEADAISPQVGPWSPEENAERLRPYHETPIPAPAPLNRSARALRRLYAALDPTESELRKAAPLARGVLDYFPDALLEVSRVSKAGNDQHNPGEEMHWAREKSPDHADCLLRHLIDRGDFDTDGQRHTAKVAWRALALLQIELEAEANRSTIMTPEQAAQTRAQLVELARKARDAGKGELARWFMSLAGAPI